MKWWQILTWSPVIGVPKTKKQAMVRVVVSTAASVLVWYLLKREVQKMEKQMEEDCALYFAGLHY